MALNDKEIITYDDSGFRIEYASFNSCILLDWENVKWKPKNIEKYVLYVLEPVGNKKNVFNGANPLIKRVLTQPRALVRISSAIERDRLSGRNIGFFVGAIEKGKSEPSWKPSSWKQAKAGYSKTPNIWVERYRDDAVTFTEDSFPSLADVLSNYERKNLRSVKSFSIKSLLRDVTEVHWAFEEVPSETRMLVADANNQLKNYSAYVHGKKSVLFLPSNMDEIVGILKKAEMRTAKKASKEKSKSADMSKSVNLSKSVDPIKRQMAAIEELVIMLSEKEMDSLIVKLKDCKIGKRSVEKFERAYMKQSKKGVIKKQSKKDVISRIICAILLATAWSSWHCYRVGICDTKKFYWDPVSGNENYELSVVEFGERKVYSGTDTTCIDKYENWGWYLLEKGDWSAFFEFLTATEVIPLNGMGRELIDI